MKQKEFYNRGKFCEDIALQFFQRQGYQLVSRNQRFHKVEIDLILKKNNEYLLVEVKSDNFWRREHPMSFRQKQRLLQAFTTFCAEHKEPVFIQLAFVDQNGQVDTFPLDFS